MPERRFIIFIVLSVVILVGNAWVQSLLRGNKPPQPAGQNVAADQKAPDQKAPDQKAGDQKAPDAAPARQPSADTPPAGPAQPAAAVAAVPEAKPQWFTLGSADPTENNPYRLLATLTNEGAAVERIEISSAKFRDLEDRDGYLGHLAVETADSGLKVNVVGPGTPAAVAGLKPGDILTGIHGAELGERPLTDPESLVAALHKTRDNETVELKFQRDGQPQTASVKLGRRPLEVVRPEADTKPLDVVGDAKHDPYSFLFTLLRIDNDQLTIKDEEKKDPPDINASLANLDTELPGVQLRTARWEGKQVDADTIEFSRALPQFGLEIVKRYHIARADDRGGYNLTFDVEIRNAGQAPRTIAYQLDGPTGLPTEGWWYNSRVSREWGAPGVRDVAFMLQGKDPALITPMQLGAGNLQPPFRTEEPNQLLIYAGVDAQYFASALLPVPLQGREKWLEQIRGILVGKLPGDQRFHRLGNVTCRLVSVATKLDPGGPPLHHTYTIFAGPKQPALLAQYGDEHGNLGELIYYGWPIWALFARPMSKILHFFYGVVGNYGIAIILLTVLVRGCMFPLSRKQALGAQKMQELKPEMDRINEKYKGKPEDRTRAMQELWRKHNYNPFSGCFVLFLQLPILIGLYRSLMIDVELRQAPLLGKSIAWCSNLAAPDMLAHWKDWAFMPQFITAYKGFGSLGPYLNILPLFTVALFLWQQKMFMPPATDEQTRTQQKMMKYMSVLIGYMFYTVPSGLCIYFITSSLWGIAERKLLPKTAAAGSGGTSVATTKSGSSGGNGSARRDRKRQPGK